MSGCPPVLLLECVEETEDAFTAVEVLAEAKVPLLQVLFLPHEITCQPDLKQAVRQASSASTQPAQLMNSQAAAPQPQPADPTSRSGASLALRQATWALHAGRIIEFFTATTVCLELTHERGWHKRVDRAKLRQDTLAQSGYAAGPAILGPGPWLELNATWLPVGEGIALELLEALVLTPLQHVTSTQLVTSRSERDMVLEAAARLSGLGLNTFFRGGGGGMGHAGPALPLPACSVRSPSDVQWLAAPGRYAVSRKADGTRCLLIVPGKEAAAGSSGGEAYLLNRVGSLYKYPVRALQSNDAVAFDAAGQATADGTAAKPHAAVIELDGSPAEPCGAVATNANTTSSEPTAMPLPSTASAPVAGAIPTDPQRNATGLGGDRTGARRADGLIPGTLLDGELLWQGGRGFFLAFDALCVGGQQLWSRPLRERLAALEDVKHGLGLAEAEQSTVLESSANEANLLGSSKHLRKRQQAPSPSAGDDDVCVLRKCHIDVSAAEALAGLEASRGRCPYATDGLVFTPYDMPYVLGMAELTYTWKPPQRQATASMVLSDTNVADWMSAANAGEGAVGACAQDWRFKWMVQEFAPRNAINFLTYECLFRGKREILPMDIRWDRTSGNALKARQQLQPGGLTAAQLEAEVAHAQLAAYVREGCSLSPSSAGSLPPPVHPTRAMPYDDLYGSVMAAVEAGGVQRSVDPGSGLELFSCRDGPQPMTLHLPRLTATLLAETLEEAGVEAFPALPGCDVQPFVASVKVDGSPVLAFTWGGQLQTAGRERMDSEQALWAREWLDQHAHVPAFRPGWTYLLEAVYGADTHVVPYAFEGVVLLGAYNEAGLELPWTQLPALANELGGWVVVAPDGQRYKHVQVPYKQVSMARQSLHPLFVWDRVCYGGATPSSLATGLPLRFRRELDAILSALAEGYGRSRGDLLGLLRHAEAEGRLADLHRLANAAERADGHDAAKFHALLVVLWCTSGRGPGAPVQSQANSTSAPSPAVSCGPPPKLLRALVCAVRALGGSNAPLQDSHVPPSMYYTGPPAEGSAVPAPSLRRLLLHCVQPSVDGTLPGYTPTGLMAQEWAKDWAQGPVGRMSRASDQCFLQAALPSEMVERCLAPLKGRDLVAGLSVCSKWCRLMREAPRPYDLASRLDADMRAAEAKKEAAARIRQAALAAHRAALAAEEAEAAERKEVAARLAAAEALRKREQQQRDAMIHRTNERRGKAKRSNASGLRWL
ncbi:hypothetical protein HYH03_000591 [Edaphochlamys debaryana]|uniref:Uncharacterized protein n=1 Tax=Edaphochlamys debaryana TaxID=47281 RepID=A0A835YQN5_9CHLO|nr:hypothetical protein HYH03_000591 [Edaphochlamys debaryana]|eukprot:KAG2502099.1 hypothetical protein HYH03_000591 [Edaphochlamys debaryana]